MIMERNKLTLFGADCYSDQHNTQAELEQAMQEDVLFEQVVMMAVKSLEARNLKVARIVICNGFVRAEPAPEFIDPRLYKKWDTMGFDYPTPGSFSLQNIKH